MLISVLDVIFFKNSSVADFQMLIWIQNEPTN